MSKKAFTLVELMIVIAIIGILAAALFPSMSTYMQRARESAAQSDIRTLRLATLKLYADTGRGIGGCPINKVFEPEYQIDGATAGLVSRPTDFTDRYGCQWSPSDGWAGPYLEKIPKDPYGRAYWYDSDYVICENGIDIVVPAIVSLGPNGLFDYPRCASGSTTDDSYFRIDKM